MRSARAAQAALFCLLCTGAGIAARAASLPHLRLAHGTAQLILHGRPFLIRGGELENSTAGTASAASTVLPALARRQFNTVLMQVAWDEIEPVEGRFDFSILNHWIAVARRRLPWRLAAHFKPAGRSWPGVFGPRADEAFMAWYYARYVNAVARAGPRQDSLPMYMNAQLPAAHQRAGEYPSGGPYPRCQPIYRAGAPAITFYAPDIYWPDFAHWVQRYRRAGNPVFVPESPPSLAAEHALYVFGQARGFGFAAFGVDSPLFPPNLAEARLAAVYRMLAALGGTLTAAQERDRIRALVLRRTSPSPTQTVALGGYLFTARLARNWFTHRLLERSGALLVLQRAPNVFDVLGRGLAITVRRDPNVAEGLAGIAGITQLRRHAGRWVVAKRLNGDQSNQGRTLLLSSRAFHLYRVDLYSIPRS